MLYFLSLGLIIILTVILTLVAQTCVSIARNKYKIKAPKTVGDDNFERIFRAHQNQLEANNIFLPLVYLQFPVGIMMMTMFSMFGYRESDIMPNLLLGLALLPDFIWLIGRSLFVYAYNTNKIKFRYIGGIGAAIAFVFLLLSVIGIGAFFAVSFFSAGGR